MASKWHIYISRTRRWICQCRIRLYSTGNLKPLGTLHYHKSGCQALAFAHSHPSGTRPDTSREGEGRVDDGSETEDDDMSWEEKEERGRWLVSGAKDNRVSLWVLMSFERE
jgi:hypothetical protein